MSRRVRAVGFGLLALLAAALAAALAHGYGARVARGYGPLRPVVVVIRDLRAERPLSPAGASEALRVRRVPERFVPPGALISPVDAVGLAPVARLPAGSYLLASELRPYRPRRRVALAAGDRRPVQIAVSGAEALLAGGAGAPGARVDVVVTTEPVGSGRGRTYVAAADVPLLALGPESEGSIAGGTVAATLGLTKSEALRLIAAESFARKLTLLPVARGTGDER
jgi:Flp pilus assembly protein CpaB